MLKATVLVPTHNHGPLLHYAVASVLGQTVRDLEVFIVGDGVDAATREAAAALAVLDSRVRFFDYSKGPRHGEASRHHALQEARGTIVCYLSDDDLWLPQHVEVLAEVLQDADFAHVLPVHVDVSQSIRCHVGHLGAPWIRGRMVATPFNFIPLSGAAHTRAFYERLPRGWCAAPPDLPTDLHMWRQILTVEGCRAVSSTRATLLNFPSPPRSGWTLERRVLELSSWRERLNEPGLERELASGALDAVLQSHAESLHIAAHAGAHADVLRASLDDCQRTVAKAAETSRAWELERTRHRVELESLREEQTRLAGLVGTMQQTITWRLRNRLLAWPGVAALARLRSNVASGR
jgi:hypothetical protein